MGWSSVTISGRVKELATIGYEAATVRTFLDALTEHGIELLVDVRAVASSRRPGFAKSALAANLQGAGIEYLHLRGLGTPAEGRAAARAGRHAEMRKIFEDHLATAVAQAELETLAGDRPVRPAGLPSLSRGRPDALPSKYRRHRSRFGGAESCGPPRCDRIVTRRWLIPVLVLGACSAPAAGAQVAKLYPSDGFEYLAVVG
jgi:hypothetical protein